MEWWVCEVQLLFCNTGWMDAYRGLGDGDRILGGGSYVERKGTGHEVCNFLPVDGTLFGFVQASGSQILINRMGAASSDESIGDITVVWTATRPRGGSVIVGWYQKATVFRSYQRFEQIPRLQELNGIDGYRISASAADGNLLPLDARVVSVPRGVKGGMGQSNVWYADAPEMTSFRAVVRNLILKGKYPNDDKPVLARKRDPLERVKVEEAAVLACTEYYESLGYRVQSVERDNVGWDLEAVNGDANLRIEVKGLSGSRFSVELTPNEFKAFERQDRDYRLAVIVTALQSPTLSICRYSDELGSWIDETFGNRPLQIGIRRSASVWCE